MIGNQLHQFAHHDPTVDQLCEDSQMFHVSGSQKASLLLARMTACLFLLPGPILDFSLLVFPLSLPGRLFLFQACLLSPLSLAAIE